MTLRILCIGRQARNYLAEAEADYRARIGAFADLAIEYIAPEDEHRLGAAGTSEKEGEKLLARLQSNDVVIACDLGGCEMDSRAFASLVGELDDAGEYVVFVIGGSHGLSQNVLARAQHSISFSRLTFPHELFRVVLLEQIYRACTIRAGRPYHK